MMKVNKIVTVILQILCVLLVCWESYSLGYQQGHRHGYEQAECDILSQINFDQGQGLHHFEYR